MDKGFWIFGGVLSVRAHIVLLAMYAIGSIGRLQEPEPVDPAPENLVQSDAPATPPTESQSDPPSMPAREYEVKSGDTLSAIARRIGCTVAELAEANKSNVRKLSRLRVGQRLLLPEFH